MYEEQNLFTRTKTKMPSEFSPLQQEWEAAVVVAVVEEEEDEEDEEEEEEEARFYSGEILQEEEMWFYYHSGNELLLMHTGCRSCIQGVHRVSRRTKTLARTQQLQGRDNDLVRVCDIDI